MQSPSKDSQTTPKPEVKIGPEAVLLSIKATYPDQHSRNIQANPQRSCFAVGGVVDAISPGGRAFSVGDSVLTLYRRPSNDVNATPAGTLTVIAYNVIPNTIGTSNDEDAVALVHTVWSAAAILRQELGLPAPRATSDRQEGDRLFNRRILVLGCETALGATMVKLFKTSAPDIKVLATATMADQGLLLARTIALVKLGATYAIDGAAEDLMEHLEAGMLEYVGVDAVIDANRSVDAQRRVLELLVGERKFVDCATVDADAIMRSMLEGDENFVETIGEVAKAIHEQLSVDYSDVPRCAC